MEVTHAERVASTVRAEMARRKVSQERIAHLLGTSQAAVSRRLTGVVPFNVEELARVATYLQVPLAALLPDDEPFRSERPA